MNSSILQFHNLFLSGIRQDDVHQDAVENSGSTIYNIWLKASASRTALRRDPRIRACPGLDPGSGARWAGSGRGPAARLAGGRAVEKLGWRAPPRGASNYC